jgi:hypothetical protein
MIYPNSGNVSTIDNKRGGDMATVRADGRTVTVELAPWERLFVGGRERLAVPLAAVVEADRVDLPTRRRATPGGRSGLVVTGILKVGRWGVGTGVRQFVSVRRRTPALRLVLDDEGAAQLGYHEVLVSTPEVDDLLAVLVPETHRG